MDKETIIKRILILYRLNNPDTNYSNFDYNFLLQSPIEELEKLQASLQDTFNKICDEREAEDEAKMAEMKNPLRDSALAAYKSFAHKDKIPMDVELLSERSIGDFYNSISFEKINGLHYMTRQYPITSPSVNGVIVSQIANSYDLSSMKEDEIHPFLTKLFYDFFDMISKFNDGISGDVIKAMLNKIELVNSQGKMYVDKNKQPSFVITFLPKGENTEIYLDFGRPNGYQIDKHFRNKFILNNSTQELTLGDKKIQDGDLELYAKDLLN